MSRRLSQDGRRHKAAQLPWALRFDRRLPAKDLSRFPRRRYTPFVTPLDFLPNFSQALAAGCPEGRGPRVWIRRDDMLGLFPGGNHFMFRLMGVEALTVDRAAATWRRPCRRWPTSWPRRAAQGRKGYIIPGGGSNALGGLGYVACTQELQQQFFEQGVQIDRVVVGSGSSGTHGGLLAGFPGNHIRIPIVGIGVSRDPQDQEPLVHR